ncbi:MAG: GNAT family N-acetyltransferase [Siculibacillus sp.]|nr:GNAT family N-acetyltransferase [Siculibacillus sp.]
MSDRRGTGEEVAIRIAAGVAEIDRSDWDRCAAGTAARPDPLLSHDFFVALEASGSAAPEAGWHPRHLVIDGADGRPAAIVPNWVKTHSQGEYVFDHGWARALERAGGRYYPKIQVSVPFTPVTGPRLLVGPGDEETRAARRRMLVAGLEALTGNAGFSSAHATFLIDEDATAFAAAGWSRRIDRQFHWPNRGYRDYDDFLSTLLGRRRKQLVRERREAMADGVEIEMLTGADIGEADWDAFFAFYMDTGSRKWGHPYLTRDFFARIGATMADRVLLVMAKRHGRRIGGALNFIGDEALYGRWWGTVEDLPFLHFEVCYHRAIDWAIARGLSRVEAGAQGEHKLARGYLPVETRSAHLVRDPGLRAAVDRFLAEEREAVVEADAELLATSPYGDRPKR